MPQHPPCILSAADESLARREAATVRWIERLLAERDGLRVALQAIVESWERTGDVGVALFALGRDALGRNEERGVEDAR